MTNAPRTPRTPRKKIIRWALAPHWNEASTLRGAAMVVAGGLAVLGILTQEQAINTVEPLLAVGAMASALIGLFTRD